MKRLGIKPEELANAPEMTKMLREDAKGGLKAVLGAMRFAADDPDINAFLSVYDSIPAGDREKVPWEAIAIKAGLNIKHITGCIQFAMREHSATRVRTLITTHQPEVVKARIKYALLPSGDKDRNSFDTISGLLPSPKGPTFIGKVMYGGPDNVSVSKDEDGDENLSTDQIVDELFPSVSEMQKKLVPIREKLLE